METITTKCHQYHHRLSSLFLLLLIHALLVRFQPHRRPPANTETPMAENRPQRTNYIVRFSEYRNSEHFHSCLKSSIVSGGWEWIERRNPAMRYPTDFGVLAIEESEKEKLIGEIEKLEIVKDVHIDFSYQRELLGGGDFLDGMKRPGKAFTTMSFSENDWQTVAATNNASLPWVRHLMMQKSQVTSLLGADALWAKGYAGAKVKMAIFDTGIRADHPHFRNIKERTNWTDEDTLSDNLGHGTFVAGVIAGQEEECLGFAPEAEIYAFRVFTDAQVSYTSWFLDAFNYAIATNMDVLNLSIGGPDYLDLPFVEKVWEITANNIIMISAIGNDGPLYGTLNNPADQTDVIGVGGIDYNDNIAPFSSRGMTTWEIPHGYGRVKPDVVAYGQEIMGSKITTGCKSLSGTSVASPVVAGVVCLLVSVIPEKDRKNILNPASMKQALVEGASKLVGPNMFEQGAGRVNLLESYEILKNYKPRASIFPSVLDFTDCPYSWPFCRQPLYAGAMPTMFNATILNGMGVTGYVESPPAWHPSDEEGNLLNIRFTYSEVIWPWTGFLALHMQIHEEGAKFSGEIQGNVTVKIRSPPLAGGDGPTSATCVLHLKLKVIPTPPRSKRVLWDQFHSIKYPPGYIPRDSLDVRNDILDWHGDHLHTNFHVMFNTLRDAGYHVEMLGSPFTCFDAFQYGTLMLVDLEDEFFQDEVQKLRDDVISSGLGLAVFSEWYNVDTMVKMRFFDDNTRSWWTPVTGGANIPAINDLLAPFGVAFGDKILNGEYFMNGEQGRYASGADIVKFPRGGFLHSFPFMDSSEGGATQSVLLSSGNSKVDSAILGLTEMGEGRVAVYGDSNCLDSSHMVTNCYWLLKKVLAYTSEGIEDPLLHSSSAKQDSATYVDDFQLPTRRTDVNFSSYSSVLGKDLVCKADSRFEVWETKGYNLHVRGRNKRLPGYAILDVERNLDSSRLFAGSRYLKPYKSRLRSSFRNKHWGVLNKDELDVPVLIASYWVVPAAIAFSGFLLLGIWRIHRRRHKRRRGPSSGRVANV